MSAAPGSVPSRKLGQDGGLFERTEEARRVAAEAKPPSAREVAAAERVAEKAIEQRDEALRLNAELESEVDELRVRLQQLQSRSDRLAGTVRRVVDKPLDPAAMRQGQLLQAIQLWDSGKV
jgi:hypothetical protein